MFNNPYNFYPYMNQSMMGGMPGAMARGATSNIARGAARGGLFRSISGIKWGNVLTNTQKTLNVINQAIPVYYQIKPIWGNIKSFGRIMSAFNEPDNKVNNNQGINSMNTSNQRERNQEEILEKKEEISSPTFFIQ